MQFVSRKMWNLYVHVFQLRRSHWPRGLRRGTVPACLLGLRVRIQPRHGCLPLVRVVCCQIEVSALDWSLFQKRPADCGVSEWDREAPITRPWPTGVCCTAQKNYIYIYIYRTPFTADKLFNTRRVSSSKIAPWKWLRFVVRTWRTVKLYIV